MDGAGRAPHRSRPALVLGPPRLRALRACPPTLKALTSESQNGFVRRTGAAWAAPVLIAAAYAALASSNGGYSTEVIAAVTVGVWWVILVGLITRIVPRRPVPPLAIAAGGCLAAFGAFTALSSILHGDVLQSSSRIDRWSCRP